MYIWIPETEFSSENNSLPWRYYGDTQWSKWRRIGFDRGSYVRIYCLYQLVHDFNHPYQIGSSKKSAIQIFPSKTHVGNLVDLWIEKTKEMPFFSSESFLWACCNNLPLTCPQGLIAVCWSFYGQIGNTLNIRVWSFINGNKIWNIECIQHVIASQKNVEKET